MNRSTIQYIAIGCIVVALSIWLSSLTPIVIQKTTTSLPSPTPMWQEQPLSLDANEETTMTANFSDEFEKNLMQSQITPTPSPVITLGNGDITPPTVTIQSPQEGATLMTSSLCFPLWVSDDITPWQQLVTRAKMDTGVWSDWSNQLSYCYTNITNGSHHFTVEIKDTNGNISTDVIRSFTITQ